MEKQELSIKYCNLGDSYLAKYNNTKALEYFKKSCELGNPNAAEILGNLYNHTYGIFKDVVPYDKKVAIKYYNLSFDLSCSEGWGWYCCAGCADMPYPEILIQNNLVNDICHFLDKMYNHDSYCLHLYDIVSSGRFTHRYSIIMKYANNKPDNEKNNNLSESEETNDISKYITWSIHAKCHRYKFLYSILLFLKN